MKIILQQGFSKQAISIDCIMLTQSVHLTTLPLTREDIEEDPSDIKLHKAQYLQEQKFLNM